MKITLLYIAIAIFFVVDRPVASGEPACAQKFESTSDGGKRLTSDCCEKMTYPAYSQFLAQHGIKIGKVSAAHNSNSSDKKYYRCGITLEWADAQKKKWVKASSNLTTCAQERLQYENAASAHKPKGVVINSTPLGFCSGDYKKHACAMGKKFFCK